MTTTCEMAGLKEQCEIEFQGRTDDVVLKRFKDCWHMLLDTESVPKSGSNAKAKEVALDFIYGDSNLTAPLRRYRDVERILDKGPPPRAEFVASAEYEDVNSTYWRGLVTSVENEWYGTQAGSVVDVLILQSNYPADIVKTVVEADNANWFFTNVYGPLAASQAAGAAPIIKAWLAGEELPATFP